MGGVSKSAPDVPDLNSTINAGVGGNIGMTGFNNQLGLYGTKSPFGTTKWKQTGFAKYTDPVTGEKYKTPTYKQKIKLSPTEQQKYDLSSQAQIAGLEQANNLIGSMGDFGLDSFDFTKSLGEIGGSIYQPSYQKGSDLSGEAWSGDPLKLGNEATEARLYELGSKRLDPQFERERQSLEANLANRGIRPGTAAWAAAQEAQGQKSNDAYNQLLLSGRAQAADESLQEWESGRRGNEQRFGQLKWARELGMGEHALGMGEQAQQFEQARAERARQMAERGQYADERFGQQGLNIQSLMALLQGGQPNMPQFTGSQPTQSPYFDYPGAINQNWDQQFKSWQQEMANKGNMMGGAMSGLGSIFASDERIKSDIKEVGTTQDGLPIYEFRIGDGEMQTGVMAQDVEQVDPSAVVQDPATGIKGVNYDQAVGDGTGTYTVEEGDNIWTIGERLGVDPRMIIEANPQLENPDMIYPGDQLVVPGMAAPGPEAIPMGGGGLGAVAAALQGPPPGVAMNQEAMAGAIDDAGAMAVPAEVFQAGYPVGAGGARPDPRRRMMMGGY